MKVETVTRIGGVVVKHLGDVSGASVYCTAPEESTKARLFFVRSGVAIATMDVDSDDDVDFQQIKKI